jgi:hypothetical protein
MKACLCILLMGAMGGLAGCQTVSQADLYQANFGLRNLPSSNFDPAAITSGPYSPYSKCNAVYNSCGSSAKRQWMDEFY